MAKAKQKFETVDKQNINVGDTVYIDGEGWKTVGRNDIRVCGIFGTLIFGQNFRDTNSLVDRALFPKWYRGEIASYVTQV
jgi:hypothetical protein